MRRTRLSSNWYQFVSVPAGERGQSGPEPSGGGVGGGGGGEDEEDEGDGKCGLRSL